MKQFLHRKLFYAILLYVILFGITTVLFSLIFYFIAKSYTLCSPIDNKPEIRYFDWLYFSIMNFFGSVDFDKSPDQIKIVVILQHFINSIILPLTSGIIFYYILNRPPKILFPNQLIVRKRTSEGTKGQLTLSVLIGNQDVKKVYDVTCQLIYIYIVKGDSGSLGLNGETVISSYVPYIENYFRFSYNLDDFPTPMLETLINREGINKDSTILLMISGKFSGLGDSFNIEKKYKMPDVIIAKENERLSTFREDVSGQIIRSKLDWSKINKIVRYNETERSQVIDNIKNMLISKAKDRQK